MVAQESEESDESGDDEPGAIKWKDDDEKDLVCCHASPSMCLGGDAQFNYPPPPYFWQAEKWSMEHFKNRWKKELYLTAKKLNVADDIDKMTEMKRKRKWMFVLKNIEFTNKVRVLKTNLTLVFQAFVCVRARAFVGVG